MKKEWAHGPQKIKAKNKNAFKYIKARNLPGKNKLFAFIFTTEDVRQISMPEVREISIIDRYPCLFQGGSLKSWHPNPILADRSLTQRLGAGSESYHRSCPSLTPPRFLGCPPALSWKATASEQQAQCSPASGAPSPATWTFKKLLMKYLTKGS